MKRRHFLESSVAFSTALGVSQFNLLRQGRSHHRVLAQPTRRKLALLIGVNNYPRGTSVLQGCWNDVDMQRALLIYRYGFTPSDIIVLKDDGVGLAPTRDNILRAFEEHLIGQARPGDVAVFHFSGHGSRIKAPYPLPGFEGLTGTLMPLDARLNRADGKVDDILGPTLYLLSRQVQTDHFTTVLDSCFSGGVRNDLVYRAVERRAGLGPWQPSDRALAYQEELMRRFDISPKQLWEERKRGVAWGMALGSAQVDQRAVDAPFSAFYAGAFTYLLTQYLWQLPGVEPVGRSFQKLSLITQDLADAYGFTQEPSFAIPPDSESEKQPIYFISPGAVSPAAEGYVESVNGDQLKLWLGGVSGQNLAAFTSGAVFNIVNARGERVGEVEQTGRRGLMGEGRLRSQPGQSIQAAVQAIQPGMLLREQIRGMPTDVKLQIGLDGSLEAERGAIAQALAAIPQVELAPLDKTQQVNLWLARLMPSRLRDAKQQGLAVQVQGLGVEAPVNSIGLLTADLQPVEASFGSSANESVSGAIARLRPRLKMLVAGQILGALANGITSDLNVTMEIRQRGGDVLVRRGSRGAGPSVEELTRPLVVDTNVEIAVTNQEDYSLYLGIIVVSSSGELTVIHPTNWDAPEAAALVPARATTLVPAAWEEPFTIYRPAGVFELLVLTSLEPLRDALKALQQVASSRGGSRSGYIAFGDSVQRGAGEDDNAPIEMVTALLGDLNRMTRSGNQQAVGSQQRSIDVTKLAAFSTVLKSVEPGS